MPKPMLPDKPPPPSDICACGLKLVVVRDTDGRTRVGHERDIRIGPCIEWKGCACGLDFVVILPDELDEQMFEAIRERWDDLKIRMMRKRRGKIPVGAAREQYEIMHVLYQHTVRESRPIPGSKTAYAVTLP